jgi:hypothetical protein
MNEHLDRDLNLKAIVGFTVGLLLVLVASAIFLWYFSKFLRGYEESLDPEPPALEAARAPYKPPGPLLQTDPAKEMEELRAEEDAILGSYGWVDEAGGIARIPIDRAITLIVESGMPESGTAVTGVPETVAPDAGEEASTEEPEGAAH